MKYDVFWEDDARSEISAEFLEAGDRVAVIDALYQIGRALEKDPIGNGTPLSEGMFYIDRIPLRAIYCINSDAKRVDVGRVRRIP